MALEHLLASVAPDMCFWYAHPWDEDLVQGNRVGEFFGADTSRLIHLTQDDIWQVNQFKALIIGGGGTFSSHSLLLNVNMFTEGLTLPIVIMGVGASHTALRTSSLLEKAIFVSGRDATSISAFSDVLERGESPMVQPTGVALVRDPVLSDTTFTDVEGKCWKQSEGERQQPLCFILPTSNTDTNVEMHRQFVRNIVRPGDVFVNVFPKHQKEIEEHAYPGEILQILDPAEFTERLCSCRAIVSTSLHGIILGLHMGVPIFGAYPPSFGHSVVDLMVNAMRLPEQLLIVDQYLTRAVVDLEVEAVRGVYAGRNRRDSIRERLSAFSEDFKAHAQHVLFDVISMQSEQQQLQQRRRRPRATGDGFSEEATQQAEVTEPGGESKHNQHIVASRPEPAVNTPSIETDTQGTRKESPFSFAEALMAYESPFKPPASKKPNDVTDAQETRNQQPDAESNVPKVSSGPEAADAILDNLSPPRPKLAAGDETLSSNGGIEGAPLINQHYMAAASLCVAIVALAVLPSGGTPRCSSHSNLLAAKGVARGEALVPHVQREVVSSCTSSDSELSTVSERSSSIRRGRSASGTGGAAATSSKMVFMLNFAMWVSLATGFNGYGKAYLGDTRDPIGLLVLQGATGVVVLFVLARFGMMDLHPGKDLTPAAAQQAGLAAFWHTGQALLTNFVLVLGEATVTNVLKAMEPVAAAAFSYLLLGKTCSGSRMAAITTIVAGVVLMTSTRDGSGVQEAMGKAEDRETDRDGGYTLISAVLTMSAVCCNALRNVVIKRGSPIPPHQTLLNCSAAATVIGATLMLLRFTFRSMDDILETGSSCYGGDGGDDMASSWVRMDGVNAALCFVGYNLASFNLLLRLSPVGHAVGISCKRMVVSVSGLLLLGEVMSIPQLGGTAVALLGVLAYNVAGTR
eukprot:g8515.t1